MVACPALLCAVWNGSLVSLGVATNAIFTTEVGKLPRKSAFCAGIVAQVGIERVRQPSAMSTAAIRPCHKFALLLRLFRPR
jgi:hypothetical protein